MDSHHDGHRDLRIFFTIGDGSCEGDDAYGSTHSKISDASDTFTSAGSADATSAGHRAAWGTAAAFDRFADDTECAHDLRLTIRARGESRCTLNHR